MFLFAMLSITTELHKVINEEKKRLVLLDKRTEQKHKMELAILKEKEEAIRNNKEEEEVKRGRRRPGVDKSFRGCTDEEAEEDLLHIFNGIRSEKYTHILPDGRTMAVIKKNKITEGDMLRIDKGDWSETGVVKCLHKGVLVLENKEREKRYPIVKLLSSRYTIIPQDPEK
ncbi:hypothetical protein NECID01_1946 [Nematocida sp. AWRm77]|nr:hypothetical protein NECID01_1946 [Nematocida sp. AWRm77]